jgi:hypothetical protein
MGFKMKAKRASLIWPGEAITPGDGHRVIDAAMSIGDRLA